MEIMLIGQNPGREEAKQHGPFIGKSGKYLDSVLRKNNIERGKLYITSVVKETTPGSRGPTAHQIRYWMPYLLEEIRQARPKTVVLMGEVAWKTLRLGGRQVRRNLSSRWCRALPKAREKSQKDFHELKKA